MNKNAFRLTGRYQSSYRSVALAPVLAILVIVGLALPGIGSKINSLSTANAAESGIELSHVNINLSDRVSLQNGARLFVNYCLSCHSAEFMRYERLVSDLGISEPIVVDNMMFTTDKIGDQMIASMSSDDSKAWFGTTPPDLSVISRARKPDYIYTYLKSFYLDPTTLTGWNNAVLKNASMPHVMHKLQGTQVLVHHDEAESESGHSEGEDDGDHAAAASMFELITPGTMTPVEFDNAMRDLTNFLAYMAEPAALSRIKIGFWVLCFLGVLLGLTWILKTEYWRDVHGDEEHGH